MTDMDNQTFLLRASAGGTHQPDADSRHDYPMESPHANTGVEFCSGLIGPASLSVAASQIAVDKATDPGARQFANFELREAVTVVAILQSLDTPVPPLSDESNGFIEKLKAAPVGAEFDKIYMTAELANHEFLRDLADSYLSTASEPEGVRERNFRNIAALALTAFKEHVVLSKNIMQAIGA